MNPVLDELIALLSLERIEVNLFRGVSHDIGTKRVYGGQVLGQAIKAAQNTVDDRYIHSLHAYFLRIGDHTAPIIYEVDRTRDGQSFSARRVVAIQHGKPIFTMAASFQIKETSVNYQEQMPVTAPPEQLQSINDFLGNLSERAPDKFRLTASLYAPFEMKPVEPVDLANPKKREPIRHLWLKATDKLPDDPVIHHILMAYVSDFSLLDTNLLPHGLHVLDSNIQIASIDHAMWFHRDFRIDDWLLYACEGVSTSGARGVARGRFFTREGVLVASTMQEGLLRFR
ncbi:MAG: acyl-CoA thioesterase II [Gammaproteobacteria bacterium RIFCSPLOWO2_12_FULL_52_10]|nr:MAG: acyl-CoA thioesterase II [Gammaproteobacteria bacterium RIFCSPLOWO2_12_FULL_52_10]